MWRVLRRYGYCLLLGSSLAVACGESTRSAIYQSASGAGGAAGSNVINLGGSVSLGGSPYVGGNPSNDFSCPLEISPDMPAQRLSVLDIDGALTTLFGEGPTLASRVTWRETGYVRVINTAFVAALHQVAVARAKLAVKSDATFEVCDGAPAKEGECAESWLQDWGARIYRRPLIDEQLTAYVAQFRGVMRDRGGVAAARNALVSMLMSPFFALRIEFGAGKYSEYLDLPELAARISHFAARTTPDDALRASADSGALANPNEALTQFQRLVATARGKQARSAFVLEWFGIDKPVPRASLTPQQQAELVTRATQLASDIFDRGAITLDALLTSPRSPDLPPELAAGMLSSEAFLTRYARPTSRGIQIQLALLGSKVPDSPVGVSETLGVGDTPRARLQAVLGDNTTCTSCHSLFDPIGLALDAFDDLGQPTSFDSSGYVPLNGGLMVNNPAELGHALAAAEQARNTAARRYLELALDRRLDDDPGSATLDQLLSDQSQSFAGQGGMPSPGIPPIPNIPIDPDTTWLRCLQHSGAVNLPLDLAQLANSIVLSDGFRRRATPPPRPILAFDASADPVEHAFQEATALLSGFNVSPDNEPLGRYYSALRETIRVGPLPGAGGAGPTDGGADAGGAAGSAGSNQGGAP